MTHLRKLELQSDVNGVPTDVSVQYPLPVDGDSVYEKDISPGDSSTGTFTGNLVDLFNSYQDTDILTDSSGTNPKTFTIKFHRPITSNSVGLGSSSGNFSNVKIQLKDISGVVRRTVDDSDNNEKFTSNLYPFTKTSFIQMEVEFHTADPVSLNGALVSKIESIAISAIDGYISETNTSEDPLGIGGVFTGTDVNTINYGMILITTFSDSGSAVNGLSIQFRSTATGVWRESDSYTIGAGEEKTFSVQTVRRFMRVVYTNGGIAQTIFDLQTTLKPVYVKPSSHKVDDTINGQDDAELSKANLIGKDQNGIYQNVRATEVGNLMVTDFLTEVSRGNIPGYSVDRKFGSVATVQATAPADIWAFGVVEPTYTFSTTADIDSVSSDNPNDNGLLVTVVGLDVDFQEVSQSILLNAIDSTTPVILATPLMRINRAFNANGVDFLGNIYVFVAGVTVGGVPSNTADVRGFIPIGEGQTLQSIYTVPAGKTAYLKGLEVSLTKAGGASAVGGNFRSQAREIDKVFRTQDDFDLISSGSSNRTYNYPIPLQLLEKTDFVPTVDVTSNGAGASWAFTMLLIDN